MRKISLFLAAVLVSSIFVTGCGTGATSGSVGNGGPSMIKAYDPKISNPKFPDYPIPDSKTFKFLNLAASLPAPQGYYMFDQGMLNKELSSTGYKAQELFTNGHQKVLPNFYNGYFDFAYIATNVLTEYWSGRVLCEPKLWKSGDEYVVIAGVYNGGISMLTAPNIYDLKALDGKKVGIMNPSYNIEMQFNKMLNEVGLKTKAVGGTVEVSHNFPGEVMNDLMAQKLSAVFTWDQYKPQLKALGFQQIKTWNQMGYDRNAPYMVLVVRKDILKKHPEVVKAVLKAHIEATLKAKKENTFIDPLIKKYNKEETSVDRKQRPKGSFKYQDLELSFDPNLQYTKDIFDYMKMGKIFKKNPKFEDLYNSAPLNEVLKEQKLSPVK